MIRVRAAVVLLNERLRLNKPRPFSSVQPALHHHGQAKSSRKRSHSTMAGVTTPPNEKSDRTHPTSRCDRTHSRRRSLALNEVWGDILFCRRGECDHSFIFGIRQRCEATFSSEGGERQVASAREDEATGSVCYSTVRSMSVSYFFYVMCYICMLLFLCRGFPGCSIPFTS